MRKIIGLLGIGLKTQHYYLISDSKLNVQPSDIKKRYIKIASKKVSGRYF
jgi:hypothetical protein